MMGEATQTDAVLASSKQEAEALRERARYGLSGSEANLDDLIFFGATGVHSLEAAVASHGDAISAEQQKLVRDLLFFYCGRLVQS